MRLKFVQCVTVLDALNECPWSSWIVQVCGGYQCFESYNDFKIFQNAVDEADIAILVYNPMDLLQLLMFSNCLSEPICYKSKI